MNPEQSRKEYAARWRKANPEKLREYERRRSNKPDRVEYHKAWVIKNKDNPVYIAKRREIQQRYRAGLSAQRKEDAKGRDRSRPSPHHGYTSSEIAIKAVAQGGCAVCRTGAPGRKGWVGDHNHVTGVFRAVLCNNCNLLLGLAHDDASRLRAAAGYIERHDVFGGLL